MNISRSNEKKKNDFTLKKTRSSWYSAETIMDVDTANDLMLLTIRSAQAEYLVLPRRFKKAAMLEGESFDFYRV